MSGSDGSTLCKVSRYFLRSTASAWTTPCLISSPGRVGKIVYMVTLRSTPLAPPTLGVPWQATHDFALNTGPRPSPPVNGSFAVHSCVNSFLPLSIAAASAATARGPAHVNTRNPGSTNATASAPKYQLGWRRFMEAPLGWDRQRFRSDELDYPRTPLLKQAKFAADDRPECRSGHCQV